MTECRSAAWPVGRAFSLAAVCLMIQAAALPPAACTAADAAVAIGTPLPRLRLVDFRGREWATDEFVGRGPVVIAFLGAECPLAGLYSARLVDLEGEFGPRGVAFVAVNANVQDSLTAMAAHARRSGISFPYLKDPDQALADGLGVTRTPEVCVVDSSGTLRYRGLIDDQYGIGINRRSPQAEPLVAALESLLANRDIAVPVTEPVGCLIGRGPRPPAGEPDESVTYANQVSRIIQRRCASCHREGDIGPMDLTRSDDVVAWSDMILEVVRDGRMPPWHAHPDHGAFANDRRLTAAELADLEHWVRAGAPLGDPAALPASPSFPSGWLLPGEPDLVVPMAAEPFAVPATGDVRYQYFAHDPAFDRDVWIRGAEVAPGNRAVVHHILVLLQAPDDPDGRGVREERGFLAGYVPGTRAELLPAGHAKRIPKGHRLVFQIHYTPIGTPQEDLSAVGFWFADPATITHEVLTTSAVEVGFRIPPHAANHRVTAVLPEDLPSCRLLAMSPHMHLRGKSFRYSALYPDGSSEILLDVPRYDFNWQTEYRLADAKPLPAGTKIHCEAAFDNSAGNPHNPDPKATVRWGDQTTEEMMIGYFNVAVPLEESAARSASAER